jgi:peptidoglycan hydrolase-like protein with peptidoglycan-binding domain
LSLTLGAGLLQTGCLGDEGTTETGTLADATVAQNGASHSLKKGSRSAQVRQAYSYLKKYGYFSNPELERYPGWKPVLKREPADPEVFDAVLEEAVRTFQGAHGLRVDGTLNEETVRLMNTPRCGFPDLYGANASRPGEVGAQYVYSGYRWDNPNLSYSFVNYTQDLPSSNSRMAILGALQRWEAVTTFNFTEVSSGGTLQIGWYYGAHGDSPFDGISGELAHAFYPSWSGLGGDVHFDDAETWRDNGSGGYDLPTVALHELGHALGLAHSSNSSAVMYAYYSGLRRDLTQDDIHGIISIYGVRAVASWGGAGPIPGKYCTQIHESADPHTWNDNYFCMDSYQGVQWSGAGPIAGLRCTQIHESADPHTWNDNYLCVPSWSSFYFSWSGAGPILGKRCVQWHESADPHTWHDNFLCY